MVAAGGSNRREYLWRPFLLYIHFSHVLGCVKLKLTAPRPKYIERFGEAFVNEMNAFAECCLDDKREFDRAHRAQYKYSTFWYIACGAAPTLGQADRCFGAPTAVKTTPDDALQAAIIAKALTHSFRTGLPVEFDEQGEPRI
jgi:myo-inositol 2-dehydrogenase/D-chiro-inositol 1-dehydrogenase